MSTHALVFRGPTLTPTLIPGAGWSGATANPGVQGSGDGSDEVAIARWTQVPHQDVTTTMTVGVVAFHMNGIDRVEFSADNGAWVSRPSMTFNPAMGYWEYWVTVDASRSTPDDYVEVRAIVYPTTGTCRVLSGMFYTAAPTSNPTLWVDSVSGSPTAAGTQGDPFDTLENALLDLGLNAVLDGYTIYLKAGNHEWPGDVYETRTSQRWLTITKDPAASVASVVINAQGAGGTDGTKTYLTHLDSVTISIPYRSAAPSFPASNPGPMLWNSSVSFTNNGGRWGGSMDQFYNTTTTFSYAACTECTFDDCKFGPNQNDLVRNCTVTQIGVDAVTGTRCLINTTVDDVDDGTLVGEHPDVYADTYHDNIILYGLRASNFEGQGIHIRPVGDATLVTNWAIVNCEFASKPLSFTSNLSSSAQHILFWNCSWGQQDFRHRHATATHVQYKNCVFGKSFYVDATVSTTDDLTALPAGASMANCHVMDDATNFTIPGDCTTGAAGFVNESGYDLHLTGTPTTDDRGTPLVVCDADSVARKADSAIGAYEL